MNWQLASFLILGVVLLAGFAWYERSRPPSQVVALVAALAALAIAGRIAFAAFPNVKPTTDIVIFAGYALGGAAGFAVGALAALVSNFWFGQGPWTPWQMAGWGLCGVLGAVLALGTRNAGRLTLAAICGFAGIAYGALLNFSLMATYGGDLSLQRFGVLEGRAVPFDAAHALGNVGFALLAGPAMVRMLARFRERFEWDRRGGPEPPPRQPRRLRPALRGGWVVVLLLAVLALGALAPAQAEASRVSHAADWLQAAQNDDGGFGSSPSNASGSAMTCWAMLGLEAAGRHPLDVVRHGNTPVDFLRRNLEDVTSPGDLARTILALHGAGVDPRSFGGENLVARLLAKRRDDGSYEGWPNSTAFAVIALRSAGIAGGLQKSLDWLRDVQNQDGGWGDVPGSPSTSDGTGAVLQALSSESKAAHRGLVYLEKAQRKGGGFPLGGNGAVNTQSTAWAIQGIRAAGADPNDFRRGGFSAPEYLANNQRDDGSYRYAKPSDQTPPDVAYQTPVWVTSTVLVAASGKYYPVEPPPRKPSSSKTSPPSGSSPTGGAPSSKSSVAGSEPLPISPTESEGAGAGPASGHSAPSGKSTSGAKPAPASPGVASGRGSGTGASTNPSASQAQGEPASESDDTSTTGAILLGALAGCLLFAAAWAARRGWLRWRYGL
jgi:energy-coupling factor transport system substrate-specific component